MGQLDALAAKSTGTTGTPNITPAAEAGLEAQTEKMTTYHGKLTASSSAESSDAIFIIQMQTFTKSLGVRSINFTQQNLCCLHSTLSPEPIC